MGAIDVVNLGPKFSLSFKNVTELNEVLAEDSLISLRQCRDAIARFNADSSTENSEAAEYYAKSTIRAFLGYVDGLGYALRRVIVKSAEEVCLELPLKKRADLMERKYDAQTDSISDKDNLLPTETSIKLAVTWFAKLFGTEFTLSTDGDEWRGFKRLVKSRNDFTHPKGLESLSARLAFAAIHPTIVWFLGQIRDLFAECSRALGYPASPVIYEPLERPYSEKAHPYKTIFSHQDISDIQDVEARTLEYVKLFIIKSNDEVKRCFAPISGRLLATHEAEIQYAIRNAVRTLFSVVEARTAAAAFFISAAEKRGEIILPHADASSLLEGEIEDKLVATLRIYSREFGNDHVLPNAGPRWKNFRGARFLRDRLTHPKDIQSLRVDSKTVAMLLEAQLYFAGTWESLLLNADKWISKVKTMEALLSETESSQQEDT
jgi:hypothetical protein